MSDYYSWGGKPNKKNMPWYEGKTLLETLSDLKTTQRYTSKPLRFAVKRVRINEKGEPILYGRVLTGRLKTGMIIQVDPWNQKNEVRSIEINRKSVTDAFPGD